MISRFMHRVSAAGLISLLLFGCVAALAQTTSVSDGSPGALLVRFRGNINSDQANAILRPLQAESSSIIPGIGVHVVRLSPNASPVAVQNVLQGRPDVEFVEANRLRLHEQTTQVIPNDPQYGSQWHLPKISAPSAWGVTKGSSGIIIAIADTGVNSTHPDLASKMVAGWNVVDNNSNTADVYGHGTQVAGVAAAASNNATGVASVAWNCWIMPVRVSQTNGIAYDSAIAGGITWAADHGARVVNVSYDVTDSSTISSAAQYMNNKGGVVTVSAGNYSTFDTLANNPYMITVGATDPNDAKYSWSDYGNDLDVMAPGCVVTTTAGGGYGSGCGTSFSAPVTAGVAALILSVKPSLSPNQVLGVLQSSADDLGPAGWDTTFGWGRVNAYKAVTAAGSVTTDTQAPVVSFVSPGASATVAGTVSVQVTATDNVGVTSVVVTANGTTIGSSASFSWNTTTWANGTYTFIAKATDAAGNNSSVSQSVTVNNVPDTTPPTVAITSPFAGATVSGTVTLTVTAQDNIGVTRVQYFCDGALIGSSSASPFSYKWNVRKLAPGAHTLQAKAFDAAGNTGVSAILQVTR